MGRLDQSGPRALVLAAGATLGAVAVVGCASVLGLGDLQYLGGSGEIEAGFDDSAVSIGGDDAPGDSGVGGGPDTGGPGGDAGVEAADGSVIVVQSHSPTALAVDDSRLYWIDEDGTSGSAIRSALKNGSGGVTTISDGEIAPTDIAVDNDNVYWSVSEAAAPDGGTACLGRMVAKTGGTPACITTAPYSTLRMTVTASNVVFLVASSPDPFVGVSAKSAGSAFQSAKTQGQAAAIAATSTEVFVSNSNGNHVDTFMLPGLTAGKILCTTGCGTTAILDLGVDATGANVLWVDQGGLIMLEPVAGSAGSMGTLLATLPTPAFRMAVDAAYAYVTAPAGAVYAVPLHGASDAGTFLTLASGQPSPFGVAVDAARVYWTNGDGSIRATSIP